MPRGGAVSHEGVGTEGAASLPGTLTCVHVSARASRGQIAGFRSRRRLGSCGRRRRCCGAAAHRGGGQAVLASGCGLGGLCRERPARCGLGGVRAAERARMVAVHGRGLRRHMGRGCVAWVKRRAARGEQGGRRRSGSRFDSPTSHVLSSWRRLPSPACLFSAFPSSLPPFLTCAPL